MTQRTLPRPLIASTGVLLLAGVLAACSPEALVERLVEEGTGVDIDSKGDGSMTFSDDDGSSWTADPDGNIVMETDDGTVEMTQGDSLPEGFPTAQVPLIGGQITSATRITNTNGVTYQIGMTVKDGAAAFADARSRLTAAGYTVASESNLDSEGSVFASGDFTGPYQVMVLVMGDTSETLVTYTVVPLSD